MKEGFLGDHAMMQVSVTLDCTSEEWLSDTLRWEVNDMLNMDEQADPHYKEGRMFISVEVDNHEGWMDLGYNLIQEYKDRNVEVVFSVETEEGQRMWWEVRDD